MDAWIASTPPGEQPTIQFASTRAYVAGVERVARLYRRAYASELGYS